MSVFRSSRREGPLVVDDVRDPKDAPSRPAAVDVRADLATIDLRRLRPLRAGTVHLLEPEARRFRAIEVESDDARVVVAALDPTDPELARVLAALPVGVVEVRRADASQVERFLDLTYRTIDDVHDDVVRFERDDEARRRPVETVADLGEGSPVVRVVERIVTQALRDRASDIHIEPIDGAVRVRFRVDGALDEVLTLPAEMAAPLVSRIKVMADMNIVERRRPQDGQLQLDVDGHEVDVRVSTTSTVFGEKAVLRLLDRSRNILRLPELGMRGPTAEAYDEVVRRPHGMVVVAGPTGSGKTTTLYATLSEIDKTSVNVTTLEDPVEYVFPGVNQIQIHEQADITFANGLRSVLRQDPDVILVGEIRDSETARMAVQSALTGHLVLSSVHALDACSALIRLVDMGIEPFLVASALTGVLAQRLVRRVCDECRVEVPPRPEEVAYLRSVSGRDKERWTRGEGCTFCSGTGYRGRTGVYEVLRIDDAVRRVLVAHGSLDDLRAAARAAGMRSLSEEACDLVLGDVTTVAEVLRTVHAA